MIYNSAAFINTRLQPGVDAFGARKPFERFSLARRPLLPKHAGEAVKTAFCSDLAGTTGLKPGVNETRSKADFCP